MIKTPLNCADYCSHCGKQSIVYQIPALDSIHRKVCINCKTIHYENPKIVVGAVTCYESKFLLCKRAIEPQIGLWTYPAGFLENGESVEQGVKREAYEEALVEVDLLYLLGTYSLTRINQVHLIYAAQMTKPEFGPGTESLEVQLFDLENIPWKQLAFPVIKWALKAFIEGEIGLVDSKSTDLRQEDSWDL